MEIMKNLKLQIILGYFFVLCFSISSCSVKNNNYDVVVYGGTPGGIMASIAAAKEGASVVLLEQTKHIGGLSTSGLNRDEGEHMDRSTLGGLCDKFTSEAARRSGTKVDVDNHPRIWQSHIAEQVFLNML
jgi:NADPH-dependent 2,4-dienoyl-CoA reductase/sulfur reductase-like enzyme